MSRRPPRARPRVRPRRATLRLRVAALVGLATATLGMASIVGAYLIVRSSLQGDLRDALRRDARAVAARYTGEGGSEAEIGEGPTGRVGVQLYNASGGLLAASSSDLEAEGALLPPDLVASAATAERDWHGPVGGAERFAALVPVSFNGQPYVVATLADPGYIGPALTRLARALALVALAVVAVSALVGYVVAGAALRPVRGLARQAARLGPDRLEPVSWSGPDDELAQLARVLNDLILRLSEAMDAQRAFLAETSHELRTPLTSLRGFLERARRRAPDAVRRDLDDAVRIGGSMSRLVEDLLQLSRGELAERPAPHLVDPLEDVLAPVAGEFPGARLAGEPGAVVLGEPERLRQLVRNLAANAARATGDPARVELGLEPDGPGRVALTVRDDGPGIPEEALPRVFDKFWKGAGGGAGLGLAIVRQIADQHGARLAVASRPGRTEFRVSFERLDEDEEAAPALAAGAGAGVADGR